MSFLQVTDLTVRYPGRPPAVDCATFSLEAGEIVGVSGASGCGKTTLALAIMGLLPADVAVSGSIQFGDRELRGLPDDQFDAIRGARMGIVFQESALALNPFLSVGGQITDVVLAHERCSRAAAMDRGRRALADVGFGDERTRIYDAYPHELSGGQRQRILIAQAIVCRPSLVIADEPVASLDAASRADVLQLIRQLNERLGTGFLLITHSAEVLASTAHRVIEMDGGRIAPAHRPRPRAASPRVETLPIADKPAAPSSAALVDVTGLTKTYGQPRLFARRTHVVDALKGIELRIERGATMGIAGPSGCGKSTLARCIAGLERADAGQIRIDGTNIGALSGRALLPYRNQIQLIFQDSSAALNPRFTALDVVTEAMVIQRRGSASERRKRAVELMDHVGLSSDRLQSRSGEFSGGERQRLAIARALAVSPRLLILDEAFSGLDLHTRERIVRLLRDLQASHDLTYICISHDLGLLSEFASDVVVMHDGRITERGVPLSGRPGSQIKTPPAFVSESEVRPAPATAIDPRSSAAVPNRPILVSPAKPAPAAAKVVA